MKTTYGNSTLDKNDGQWRQPILIGTPMTGLVRSEWALARFGQMIPTNWAMVSTHQPIPNYAPLEYLVADAQNIIVRNAIEGKFEWLLLIEQDNVPPYNSFMLLNEYMHTKKVPIISGLYFTKSVPPEPLLYRGRGTGYYDKWHLGDKVWVDGVPTGFLLIHMSILKVMWDEAPEYYIDYGMGGNITRRVFENPNKYHYDPQASKIEITSGTSDLDWCSKVMKNDVFNKAGWPKYSKMKYPFLVDTNILIGHIDDSGRNFPLAMPAKYMPK